MKTKEEILKKLNIEIENEHNPETKGMHKKKIK